MFGYGWSRVVKLISAVTRMRRIMFRWPLARQVGKDLAGKRRPRRVRFMTRDLSRGTPPTMIIYLQ